MASAVITVASGGLPVTDVTATAPLRGMAVTEALNGRGIAVTKGAGGLPVTFVFAGNEWPSGGGGGGGGFTPASLTGLIGWWDASVLPSLSLTGADINSVADQSGGGRTMSWTGFVKPTYSATGFNSTKPAILVANGSALISALGFPMGTGNTLTAWHVGTMCNSSGSDPDARAMTYFALGASTDFDNVGSWAVYRNGSTTQVASFIRNLNIASTAATVTAYPAPHRFIYTINSSGAMTLYIDGVSRATATAAGNWISGGILHIGNYAVAGGGGGRFWSGQIAEAGVATGFSDATVVAQLDTYLKDKWGLGGGGSFTPADLTGLIGWWDVSVTASLTLSGTDIRHGRSKRRWPHDELVQPVAGLQCDRWDQAVVL